MKKWIDYLPTFGVIILLLMAVSLFAGGSDEEQKLDPISQEVVKLQKDLTLDTTQSLKVREIIEKKFDQTTKDREQFKLSAQQLIESARNRKESASNAIYEILTPNQQETFTRIKKMTALDRELNMWSEGLLLNDDQAFTVEGILIEFYNRLEEMIPEGMRPPAEGEKPDTGLTDDMNMKMGMGRGGFRGAGNMMWDMQSKKHSKIKKLLSSDQINLFKQIMDDLKKKKKEFRKRRR